MKKTIKKLFYIKLSIVVFWLLGFIIFAIKTNYYETDKQTLTDAVIVFGSNPGRLYTGLELINLGYANIILITGYYNHKFYDQDFLQDKKIAPERMVVRQGNDYASDVNWFIREYQFDSLRLVADNDQMPRAIKDLRNKLPSNILIVPHAVSRNGRGYGAVFIEYNKYLLTFVASFMGLKNEFSLSYS